MNPAYRHARFRAGLPYGGLPESFAVITACNPNGETISDEANAERTRQFETQLCKLGLIHFPVTGYDPQSDHAEPGFGVLCDEATAYGIGNGYLQEAVFQVRRNQVTLISCDQERGQVPLGKWTEMATAPASDPRFHFRGSVSLLENPATVFLCSTQCPADKILEAYEWARRQCDDGGTVISGFHTPVEKDVLAILARRGAKILWVPARDLPMKLDAVFKTAMDEDRLLILSPFPFGKPSRPTKESCSERNRFVLARATERFIPHVAEGSSLASDLESFLI